MVTGSAMICFASVRSLVSTFAGVEATSSVSIGERIDIISAASFLLLWNDLAPVVWDNGSALICSALVGDSVSAFVGVADKSSISFVYVEFSLLSPLLPAELMNTFCEADPLLPVALAWCCLLLVSISMDFTDSFELNCVRFDDAKRGDDDVWCKVDGIAELCCESLDSECVSCLDALGIIDEELAREDCVVISTESFSRCRFWLETAEEFAFRFFVDSDRRDLVCDNGSGCDEVLIFGSSSSKTEVAAFCLSNWVLSWDCSFVIRYLNAWEVYYYLPDPLWMTTLQWHIVKCSRLPCLQRAHS